MKKGFILLITIIAVLFSCNRINNANSGKLSFYNDTVFFDTIFTQIGSTTKMFTVHNQTNKAIKIDRIFLLGQNSSKYRLNIDGSPENEAENIIIDAKDSLFIFVEVTINTAKDNLIEEDAILFVSGDYTQKIILYAVGKDVHLINSKILQTQTWIDDKPYLIYNSVLVDSLETLTIEPGVEIYSHRYSNIYVKGTVIANGNIDNIIELRGDRIDDSYYTDKPGQWGGFVFLFGSENNILDYVKISEATVGVFVDTMLNDVTPTVTISNTEISHCSHSGIYALNTYIEGYNMLISDCGVHNIGLFMSGIYKFYHCTLQNNYSASVRNSPVVGIQNYYVNKENEAVYGGFISALFVNSIIYGNLENEFVVSAYDKPNSLEFLVQNCMLKLDLSLIDTSLAMFENVIVNEEPNYVEKEEFNFHLTKESPAIDKANFTIDNLNIAMLQFDIDGIDRLIDSKPDIGAFEFIAE